MKSGRFDGTESLSGRDADVSWVSYVVESHLLDQ